MVAVVVVVALMMIEMIILSNGERRIKTETQTKTIILAQIVYFNENTDNIAITVLVYL